MKSSVIGYLDRLLGQQFHHFSEAEIEGLANIFIRAGEMAVLAHIGSPTETAKSIEFSKSLIKTARAQQAASTPTGYPDRIFSLEWQTVDQIGKDNSNWILQLPGVIGLGPAYKIKEGFLTGEVSLAIYVREKLPNSSLGNRLSIPYKVFGRNGISTRTDVIELGPYIEMSAVKIGDSVSPKDANKIGTIGALATDLDTSKPVAITAMHVTGLRKNYPEDFNNPHKIHFSAPSHRYHNFEPLGYLLKGKSRHSNSGVDASSISIENNRFLDFYHPRLGEIIGWRPVSDTDYGLSVQMYGDRSRYQTGKIVVPVTNLTHIGLESVILVDINTNDGDSGAALVDGDGCILGILSGRIKTPDKYYRELNIQDVAVFCTIGYVLQSLNCDIIK